LITFGLLAYHVTKLNIVVILGHPGYYRKFGFRTASDFWIECGYDVPKEMFMLREMSNNALQGKTGVVRYRPEFDMGS